MIARILSLFLLLFTARLSLAQPLPDRFPLAGRAVDSHSGKPLPGAVISIRRQEDSGAYAFWGGTAAADTNGEFRFPFAETGRYYLNAELAGYAPIYNQSISWKNGDAPLRVTFDRLVTLHLQVRNADGAPVANTSFWLRLRGDGSAGQVTRRVQSDGDGRLNVESLLPAKYALFLVTGQGVGLQNDLDLHSELTQALTLQRGGALHAVVRDDNEAARPLGGAVLSLAPADPDEATRLMGDLADPSDDLALLASSSEGVAVVTRDGDGTIEISNIPAGSYLAKIYLPGAAGTDPQPVTIKAGETTALEWRVKRRGATASLTIQLSEPGAKPGQTVSGEFMVRLLLIEKNGQLRGEEANDEAPFSPGGSPGRRALANGSGQITLFPLKPTRYRIFVSRRVAGQDPESGSREAASLDITVPAEGTTASLVLKP